MAYDSKRQVAVLIDGYAFDQGGERAPYSEHWEWDGARWSFHGGGLGGRYGHGLVYDAGRDQLVAFGGAYSAYQIYGDTWVRGEDAMWVERKLETAPSPRVGHAMVYAPSRGVTYVLGGWTEGQKEKKRSRKAASRFSREFWQWDGNAWTKLKNPPKRLVGRSGHAMAWDPRSEQLLVYGGRGQEGLLSDLWTWDGKTWTRVLKDLDYDDARELTGKRPWRMENAWLAFQPTEQRLLLGPGSQGQGESPWAWELDGKRTRRLDSPYPNPFDRCEQSAVPFKGRLLLFGGSRFRLRGNERTYTVLDELWTLGAAAEADPAKQEGK